MHAQSVANESDAISLALGRAVAAALRARPELVEVARENLRRWSQRNADSPALLACYQRWARVLDGPLEGVCQLLEEDTQRAQLMRPGSPFAGVLSPREVWAIKKLARAQWRSHHQHHQPPTTTQEGTA
jgi:hypothetical protein